MYTFIYILVNTNYELHGTVLNNETTVTVNGDKYNKDLSCYDAMKHSE